MYSHLVMFTLEDPDDIPATVTALEGMAERIPQLRYVEVGVDCEPSPRSAHIVLITRFDSKEAYAAYHAHPHHQRVLEHMGEVTKSAIKVDYVD
ncbi:MAG: Dabb family protein [Deltaproteobacteria bacterium]|nr:Dabb family protein [Deltaproteobacteria bacterium]